MEFVDLPDFGPDDYAQIVDGEVDPFQTDHMAIEWCEKTVHVGIRDDGRLIAQAGWVPAQVQANGPLIEVLGLGGVIVHQARRGQGVGEQLVSGAMRRMAERGGSLGMLFCRTERVPFYGRLGWVPIEQAVTVDQPDGPITLPFHACWASLIEGAGLPDGDLHVVGLPF